MKNKYVNFEKENPINIEVDSFEEINPIEEKHTFEKPSEAVVTGCTMLRVRSNPNADAPIVGMLNEGTEMTILEELPDWFKMVSKHGNISGYCMRKFTRLKF